MFCTQCGTKNPEGARFCANCGAALFAADDTPTTTAGRHPESDIFLDDITVSRRHAEIRRGANGFTVHDVGSLNGTYLNRERVEDGELVAGDELQIGKFKLVFFAGSRPGGGGQG